MRQIGIRFPTILKIFLTKYFIGNNVEHGSQLASVQLRGKSMWRCMYIYKRAHACMLAFKFLNLFITFSTILNDFRTIYRIGNNVRHGSQLAGVQLRRKSMWRCTAVCGGVCLSERTPVCLTSSYSPPILRICPSGPPKNSNY